MDNVLHFPDKRRPAAPEAPTVVELTERDLQALFGDPQNARFRHLLGNAEDTAVLVAARLEAHDYPGEAASVPAYMDYLKDLDLWTDYTISVDLIKGYGEQLLVTRETARANRRATIARRAFRIIEGGRD